MSYNILIPSIWLGFQIKLFKILATFWETKHTKHGHDPDMVPTKLSHDFEQLEYKKGNYLNLILAVFFCTGS